MTHRVEHVLVDGDRLAYGVACRYPNGARVSCMATAELSGGRIVREHAIQVWDE